MFIGILMSFNCFSGSMPKIIVNALADRLITAHVDSKQGNIEVSPYSPQHLISI
jgi:hypothetical protein